MRWITVSPADQRGTSIVPEPPAAGPSVTDDERRPATSAALRAAAVRA
jgi:hypothetical protein